MKKMTPTSSRPSTANTSSNVRRDGFESGGSSKPGTPATADGSGQEAEAAAIAAIQPDDMVIKPLRKVREAITKFRSLARRGKAEKMQSSWGKRMYESVVESTGTDEFKSASLIEFFESELLTVWLYCKHVSLILELFSPLGLAPRSTMGSYRVELIVLLFDRIVDLHNFEVIFMVLNSEEHAAVLSRIGYLNLFNSSKPEGSWAIDLSRHEERQVTKLLIHLSVVEPGENCKFLPSYLV
jgi:hypothetical protein